MREREREGGRESDSTADKRSVQSREARKRKNGAEDPTIPRCTRAHARTLSSTSRDPHDIPSLSLSRAMLLCSPAAPDSTAPQTLVGTARRPVPQLTLAPPPQPPSRPVSNRPHPPSSWRLSALDGETVRDHNPSRGPRTNAWAHHFWNEGEQRLRRLGHDPCLGRHLRLRIGRLPTLDCSQPHDAPPPPPTPLMLPTWRGR
jgi:hypothetical protein